MDYESHPDDNIDYAHATHWTIKWTCRCGKQHVTSSPGRYVTQTCKKCGVRWEIAPHLHDTTYHECVTEPITGAAEIESQPQDGRRIENRVSALENSLFKLSEDHNTTLRQMIDLQQQVQELTERVRIIGDLGDVTAMKTAELMIDRDQPTPPQPADDDAGKWEAVHAAYQHAGLEPYAEFKAAVAEAVNQGLVPVIDPLDGAQVRVVADAMPYRGDASENGGDMYWAKRILTALAGHLNGRTNG